MLAAVWDSGANSIRRWVDAVKMFFNGHKLTVDKVFDVDNVGDIRTFGAR